MDVEAIKRRGSAFWSEGDYTHLSELVRPAAVELCDACAVSAGQEVLDVAAGDGNFALACAREGARVVAADFSPGQVERGRRRTAAEGYDVEWQLADVEDLPFADASFDCVGSVFGAMIAPRPRVVAEELFRVVRPGGTVGMTAWTPDSFFSELFTISREYAPRPPDQPLLGGVGGRGERARALRRPRRTLRGRAPHASLDGRVARDDRRRDGRSRHPTRWRSGRPSRSSNSRNDQARLLELLRSAAATARLRSTSSTS